METNQNLIFTNHPGEAIDRWVETHRPSGVFIVTDSTVQQKVLPRIASTTVATAPVIAIEPGDTHKTIQSLDHIWSSLCELGATRSSALINIGGGMSTDIGGFAGATFKRGIPFINVPTSLLAAVDAAVGGKTGINFRGLKNEIGSFREADTVIISSSLFDTLPREEMLSGYAEMLKHGLISDAGVYRRLIAYDITAPDPASLLPLLEENVRVKQRVVTEDPTEKGIRRALNLGHTPGHAFESLMISRGTPVPHGYAVAWGLVVDLILSHMKLRFPSAELQEVARFVRAHYGAPAITCHDYPEIIAIMRHDKKNRSASDINFTLLSSPGEVKIDCTATPEEIAAALDIFRDLLGI